MQRREDWMVKLDAFIEETRNKPFKRGVNDCVIFGCNAIKAMTDEDLGKKYRGVYKNKKEAFELIKSMGNKDLIALAVSYLGKPMENINFASRGDLVAVKYGDELGLAIIDLTGRKAVTTGKQGLMFYGPQHWLKAWRV